MMKFLIPALAALALGACAEQASMKLAKNISRISISTAPIYGTLEPQRRAMLQAAKETLNSGYDTFLVLGSDTDYNMNLMGAGAYGTQSIPRFSADLTIKMFKYNEAGSSNAIDAREIIEGATNG